MSNEIFNPYIEGAVKLTADQIDSHTRNTPVVYYGETINSNEVTGRISLPGYELEDDSGKSKINILISGDISCAKSIIIKTMPWSDWPGRGFEAMREALTATSVEENELGSSSIAVIGVSFPGMGDTSTPLTNKQKESMRSGSADFSLIASQQWEAIKAVFSKETERIGSIRKLEDYSLYLSGNSLGASNAIALAQTIPQKLNLEGIQLIEPTAFEKRNGLKFRKAFAINGGWHFKEYVAENGYNQYPDLGPDPNMAKLQLRGLISRPETYITDNISVMARGGDVERILKVQEVYDRIGELVVSIVSGGASHLSPEASNLRAAERLKAAGFLMTKATVLVNHGHPMNENLSNDRLMRRSIIQ